MSNQEIITVKLHNAIKIVRAIPGSELCSLTGKEDIGIKLPIGCGATQAEKIIEMILPKPKLTGLHALLCPRLIYTGFQIFSREKINLICSITETGSFTNPSPNCNKPAKKAESLLPLSFRFCNTQQKCYDFNIRTRIDEVWGSWKETNSDYVIGGNSIWEAVQDFEIEFSQHFKQQ